MCNGECRCGSGTPCALSTFMPAGVHILRRDDRPATKSRTLKFEGGAYGVDLSFFAVHAKPGSGPDLHVHPYAEVWVVRRGRASFQAGGEELLAGPDDIVVVATSVPHKFVSIGDEPLDMVCIHDSGRIEQVMLEGATE